MTDTITVTGNIATPPEHKRTPGGVAITTFRVASGLRRFDRNTSSWVDSGTNWYTVSTFRSLAEHAMASLNKGDRVIVTGRLRLREWDTGAKKGITAEIDADAIGHDLLFGTTRFERGAGVAGAAPASWTAPPTPEAWAVPGTEELEQLLADEAAQVPDEAVPEDVETPF
ncbi:single-stranded DNA-binding protein [Microbacterium sp. NPDC019599]|uniref:single-stranded DNA-binding protein n=1 Tax=Microbacterium sp. NPDC019599 TaxID=3154690 RepID=UPI0033F66738